MSTGVDLENYIHSIIELTLLYDNPDRRLDELIDYWEEQCWSTHVPNDGLSFVIDCVTELYQMYKREIGFILPNQCLGMYTPDTNLIAVETLLTHTTITISPIGGTSNACNVIAPTRAM